MTPLDLSNTAGHECATITGDLLRKTVFASRHFLQQPPAICFDVAIVEQAQRVRVQRIAVHDSESGRVYRVDFATFLAKSFPLERRFGRQLALPLRYWRTDEPTTTDEQPTPTPQPRPAQLALWQAEAER